MILFLIYGFFIFTLGTYYLFLITTALLFLPASPDSPNTTYLQHQITTILFFSILDANDRLPFLSNWIIFHCMCEIYNGIMLHLCIHPSTDTWVCFPNLAFVLSSATNIKTQIFLWHIDVSYLNYMPNFGVAGSYGSFIFKFLESCHTVFHKLTYTCEDSLFPHTFTSICHF